MHNGGVSLDDHAGHDGPMRRQSDHVEIVAGGSLLPCARSNGLRAPFDLDQTHSTVTSNHEFFLGITVRKECQWQLPAQCVSGGGGGSSDSGAADDLHGSSNGELSHQPSHRPG